MNIKFYSFIDGNRYEVSEKLTLDNNSYRFNDKENAGYIEYKLLNQKLYFKRVGNSNMDIVFDLNNHTKAKYKNSLGLEFDFLVKTKRLDISQSKIIIEYDYYIDGQFQSNVKLYLLVENGLEKK